MLSKIFIGVFLSFTALLSAQQNNVLTTLIDPKLIIDDGSIEDILSDIEAHYNISFSYSPSQFDLNQNVQVKTVDVLPLNAYLREIFYKYQLKLKSNENKVIITGELKKIRVFGFIRDQASGESLAGSIIINKNSNEVYSPNSTGYYSLTINTDSALIETRVLGYLTDSIWVRHQGTDRQLDIKLKFNNKLGTVTVSRNVQDNLIYDPGGTLVTIDKIYGNKGISGEEDIVHSLKMHDGVTSGVEGGLGININGGNIDQNLILFDGMPVYEISHIAGINSIFLNESIQSVNLMKTGIPARYNGRLSSVIDVRLKDGHNESPKRSISLGLTGAKFGFEGPLNSSQSTTFNLSGRASLLNYTLRPVANKFTNFENVNLDFFDVVGKITHRFDKKNKLSLTTYFGGDRIKLIQDDSLENVSFKSNSRDINELRWGNKLVSVNYGSILNSKVKIAVQGGWTSYNYFSNGYYEYFSDRDGAEIDRVIDVVSYSSIDDFQLNASMDFYVNDQIKLKSGVSAIRHVFKPSVRQSLIKVNEELSSFEAPDTSIFTNELSAFTEFNLQIGKYIYVYPGVNINSYFVEDHVHHTIQPRAKLLIVPAPNTIISTSFSRMAQNLHLLSNPGLGIASDLWVPSTKQYKPSISNQIDIEFKQTLSEGINLGFTWYNKNMDNLLVYSVPIDLHANVIIQEQNEVFLTNESDWKQHVEVGRGTSTGFTVSLKKETGKFKGWITYHNNSNKRTFENLNDGNTFSAKHERPHDLNIALSYELTSKLVLGVNWVYTSGGTFSLPNEQFLTNVGLEVLRPDGRNNFRLPAYHQMSISGEYEFNMFKTKAHLNFGIYNIYNRLNPFYLYATNDPSSEIPLLKKVSIFPILPFASITWQW